MRRIVVMLAITLAVIAGVIASVFAATARQNRIDDTWRGAPSCPAVAAGDSVDAKINTERGLQCQRLHSSGITRIVAGVEFINCADGTRLYTIDRRGVDDLAEDERIALHGVTGGRFASGVPAAELEKACRG